MNLPYAEIGITTNFSFLRGGSDPRAYVHEASRLNIPAIGIADHNTLSGVVRAWKELDHPEVLNKPKLLIGARLVFIDGTPDILAYPRDRAFGPGELAATIFHALGIDPQSQVPTLLERPWQICEKKPVLSLWG